MAEQWPRVVWPKSQNDWILAEGEERDLPDIAGTLLTIHMPTPPPGGQAIAVLLRVEGESEEAYLARGKLIQQAPKLLEALLKAEDAMDAVNGNTGTKGKPCCFCLCQTYNAEVGIEHAEECPVLNARAVLKEAKDA